jgi:molecular chaperone DnaK
MHVTAKDKATGKENKITIKANSGLSEDEIQRMVKDAESHADEDRKQLEIVQARNQGDALVHQIRKSLGDYGDKIDAAEKDKIARGRPQDRHEGRDRGEDGSPRQGLAEARREDLRRRAGEERRRAARAGGPRPAARRRRAAAAGKGSRRQRGGRGIYGSEGQEVGLKSRRRAHGARPMKIALRVPCAVCRF